MFAFVLMSIYIHHLPREVELRGVFCRYRVSRELTNRFLPAITDYLTFSCKVFIIQSFSGRD